MTLADKIEALDGPDREIDAEIVKHLFPDAIIGPYCVGDDEPVVFHAQPLIPNKTELPRFSDSVDAALTLVDLKQFSYDVDATAPEMGIEFTLLPSNKELFGEESADAKTLPLAICAAALRAREASQ